MGFTTTWNTTTINGRDFLVIDTAAFRIPLDFDPTSSMFIAVAAPDAGVGNFPALVKGDPGDTPTINATVNLTVLDPDDSTPDSATWTALSATEYQLNLALHKGAKGDTGDTIIDPTDYGAPQAGQILIVNPTIDGMVLASQKVGDRYAATTINSTPAGNPAYTLAAVGVPAQTFDWRPEVSGVCVVQGTGTNVQVDIVARLNNQASGNIIGVGIGAAGQYPPPIVLADVVPAGSSDSYDRVTAGSVATIYLRAERQSGTDTFTTSSTTTWFKVKVAPCP